MKSILSALCACIIFSCNQAPVQPEPKEPIVANNDSAKFFQVTQYLNNQLKTINSTPFFIYHIHTVNDKKDSAAIDVSTVNAFANKFLTPNINEPALKKYYTENIFFDETIKRFTLSYTTTNKELEVQNIDVLLAEDGETVQRIFIKKFFNYTDSSASEQLSWRPDRSFQIVRLVQTKDKEISRQDLFVWNDKDLK